MTGTLSTRTATALYVGAVLGPGVLILPALAAEAAGPASVLAWAALLALSAPLIRWVPEQVALARPILAEAAAGLTRRLGGEMPERPRQAAE